MPAPAPNAPAPGYLAEAQTAGWLRHHMGLPYVAGHCADSATGESLYLAEYCHPELLTADLSLAWLADLVRAQHPGTDLVVVRAPGCVELPLPWHRHQTYVRRTAAPPAAPPSDIDVVPAGPEHTPLLLRWLRQAIATAADVRGRPSDVAVLHELAEGVLDSPGRRSLVALYGGSAVGHLTLRLNQQDEVTGERYVELFDVLVEPAPLRKDAGAALLAAALGLHAGGDPVLGQVHHPDEELAPGHGERVLGGLLASGWAIDHTFWRLTP